MPIIVDGKERIRFMRGMLVHYLIEHGFSHKDARGVANAVRDALGKADQVRKKDMIKIVGAEIQNKLGECEIGNLVFWRPQPTAIAVECKGELRPFSKELLAHSIQASGLFPDQSYDIAQRIESRLMDEHRQNIRSEELEQLTGALVEEVSDQAYAERYFLWRAWSDVDKPLVILIGGASGVGKTSLAIEMAKVLNINRVVATDDLRQVMRLMLSQDLEPTLHKSSFAAWESILTTGEEDAVITGFRAQARVVCVGVKAIISRCIEENTSVIIDGVHLIGDMLGLYSYADKAFVAPICLEVSDRETFKKRFALRASESPLRPVHRYITNLDQIIAIQNHLIDISIDQGIPVVPTGSIESLTSVAAMAISEKLQEQKEVVRILQDYLKQR